MAAFFDELASTKKKTTSLQESKKNKADQPIICQLMSFIGLICLDLMGFFRLIFNTLSELIQQLIGAQVHLF